MAIRTLLVTQARSGSTRLPGKILKEIGGKSLLQIHLERLSKCTKVSEIIVATTDKNQDLIIFDKVSEWGFKVSRGSELDVLDRFYQAVKNEDADWIVRVTSDCPLLDPKLVDQVITFVQKNNMDYGSNVLIEHFPDGQDIEVFKFSALQSAWENAELSFEREHVTPYIKTNSNFNNQKMFSSINYDGENDFGYIRMTVDELEDFQALETLINELGQDRCWLDYANYIINNPNKFSNQKITRNEGFIT